MRPLLLDLYCCGGGASMGYYRAGFDVVGVDIAPQKNYPFEFVQADALEFLGQTIRYKWDRGFAAIHASPPCQRYSAMSACRPGLSEEYPDLVGPTRDLLEKTGLPYVIENVPGARGSLVSPFVLTGEMFGLDVHRPRLFETNWPILVPQKPPASPTSVGVYGKAHDGRLLWRRRDGSEQRCARTLDEARAAMGIDWMEWRELAESIPPAYTAFIGDGLARHVRARAAA
jgi:DNA (cytosine-5)-methyltransferase 1